MKKPHTSKRRYVGAIWAGSPAPTAATLLKRKIGCEAAEIILSEKGVEAEVAP